MTNLQVDSETLRVIDKVLRQLAPKFTFDSYDIEDIYQEGFQIACKALPKYDPSKGTTLSTFLYTVLSTRLLNFIRDNSVRSNNHCIKHPVFKEGCKACTGRQETQNKKRGIQKPRNLNGLDFANSANMLEEVEIKEVERLINKQLPKAMREDYLLMKEGGYVSRSRRLEIEAFVLELINER